MACIFRYSSVCLLWEARKRGEGVVETHRCNVRSSRKRPANASGWPLGREAGLATFECLVGFHVLESSSSNSLLMYVGIDSLSCSLLLP